MKKLLALLLALVMVVGMVAACTDKNSDTTPAPTGSESQVPQTQGNESESPETENPTETPDLPVRELDEFTSMTLGSLTYNEDYKSLYEHIGEGFMIKDVVEGEDGFAYTEVDGMLYPLGLDFLSMAMVYNNDPEGSEYETADDVYAAWWRYYITRWNYLLPEIPLYSNEYYDLYNSKIKGVTEHTTNPFWNVADALIDWSSEKDDKGIIIGSSTDLSGHFRAPSFGKNSAGSSDNDVNGLATGLTTVTKTKEGGYEWNKTVVKAHEEIMDAEGNKEFKITIYDDMKFSDGTPVTAADYVAASVASLTPVYTEAASKETSGRSIVGWKDAFQLYTGPGSEKGVKEIAGFRLYDEYTFSVIIDKSQLPYFYDITYASFSPVPKAAYIGNAEIKDDGNGCYLSDDFYAKDGEGKYEQAKAIFQQCTSTKAEDYAKYPWSGPYYVSSFDQVDGTAVLLRNPYFKGNYEGTTPKIEKVVYRKIVASTQLEDFKSGGLDVISAITGGKETDEALKAVEESNGAYTYSHYSRAGYGKLGMRCDYGPVQFLEVRQAIAYCMDRAKFAKDFTGGYGGVVDGPYYKGSWMYKAAMAQGMDLDTYATSADSAIKVLEAGGWVYNAEGGEYTSGVRYKKIPGDKINENDAKYQSVDGMYKTTKVGDDYYMPLVLNWFGTVDNEFTELLQTGFRENPNIETAGMKVYNTIGDFYPMLDELYQTAAYGYYQGTPMYTCFNFATGFSSAIYDFSWNLTIDPDMFNDLYNSYFIKDAADVYFLK